MDTLGLIASIIAIITALIAFIAFISESKFVSSDIIIKSFYDTQSLEADADYKTLKYHNEYSEENGSHGESSIFINRGNQLKSVKLYSVESKKGKWQKGSIVAEFGNIDLDTGILFNIYNTEGIPNFLLEWTLDYSIKGNYYFSENGFNGNRNVLRYEYKKSFLNKLRQIIKLR